MKNIKHSINLLRKKIFMASFVTIVSVVILDLLFSKPGEEYTTVGFIFSVVMVVYIASLLVDYIEENLTKNDESGAETNENK